MNNWKNYRKKGVTEMRPYVVGEDLTGVSVSDEDRNSATELTEPGGFIARNSDNHDDRWYIAKDYHAKHYEPAE